MGGLEVGVGEKHRRSGYRQVVNYYTKPKPKFGIEGGAEKRGERTLCTEVTANAKD